MVNIANGEWVVDLGAMTCRNYTWGITVAFEKQGEAIIGKISNMPDNLIQKWTLAKNRSKILEKIVKESEEIFSMAYFENELEKCGVPKHHLRDREQLALMQQV